MKVFIIAYMVLYLLIVLGATLYSFFKTKKMNSLRLGLVIFALVVIAISLFFYAQVYHPLQMVGIALAFTSISSLFLYNSLVGENNSFFTMFGLSFLRLVIHLQLLFLLYFFR
ncbi:hypothetical protein D3X11_02465 [Streptococcus sp. X16XC17]|uniref:hypothetical protein n=1 Tax=unclassified Streptococcus TaxID=2608887 RepID=UPI00066FCF9F|nr:MULTISPECIES: hypothetical protein [unclassified Streptococcus]TCD46318.1 hypothetical protein D3X11_02465 [Streptococcus sp. X16XC17]